MNALYLAIVDWWESHRPVDYTLEMHLENPTINLQSHQEKVVAILIANFIKGF